MKTRILTIGTSIFCLAAFGQGKLTFSNDSVHLVYFDPGRTAPGDSALEGRGLYGVTMSQLVGGPVLLADLYAGTSSTTLSLVSTTTFGNSIQEGRWVPLSISFNNPPIPAGQTAFLQVQIRDNRDATELDSALVGHYFGHSQIFSVVVQTVSDPMYSPFAPTFSTWAAGTFNMDFISPGFRGAIPIGVIPEPTTAGLLGLGLATLVTFRRRNKENANIWPYYWQRSGREEEC